MHIKKISLSILLLFSLVLSAQIELNNSTEVNFEILSDQSLNMSIELGHINIEQTVQNGQNFILLNLI